MAKKKIKFSATIEIEANVDVETNEEAVAFILDRLNGLTVRSINGTELCDWDCEFSNVKLTQQGE